MNKRNNAKLISVVIPCYHSASYLADTVEQIRRTFSEHPDYTYRLILINDGSPDDTFSVIRELCSRDHQITGINLERNYGQGLAKMVGIPFIQGEYAVFMDDDGQHDPEAIFTLIQKIDQNYDLVYAMFQHMKEPLWRRAASRVNDLILCVLTGKPRGLTITSFFALSSRAVEYLKHQEYYAASVGLTLFPYTKKVTGIFVDHKVRTEGSSHYTLRKLFKEWQRMLKGSKCTIPKDICYIQTILNES